MVTEGHLEDIPQHGVNIPAQQQQQQQQQQEQQRQKIQEIGGETEGLEETEGQREGERGGPPL